MRDRDTHYSRIPDDLLLPRAESPAHQGGALHAPGGVDYPKLASVALGIDPFEAPEDFSALDPSLTKRQRVALEGLALGTYEDNVVINPAPYTERLSDVEVVELMHTNGGAKRAPTLREVLGDSGRADSTHELGYVESGHRLGADTSRLRHMPYRKKISERDAYREAVRMLDEAVAAAPDTRTRDLARRMVDTLAPITVADHNEAAKGMAEYLKWVLKKYPHKQVFVLAGRIAETSRAYRGQIKSDEALFDDVLSNFTDEEIAQFGDRLVRDVRRLKNHEDVLGVFMDDRRFSDEQFGDVVSSVLKRYPWLEGKLESWLVVASEHQIKEGGLDIRLHRSAFGKWTDKVRGHKRARWKSLSIPVRSYYVAPDGSSNNIGLLSSTSSKSSGDYGFTDDIVHILKMINPQAYNRKVFRGLRYPKGKLPALANLLRPYRKARLHNIERLKRLSR